MSEAERTIVEYGQKMEQGMPTLLISPGTTVSEENGAAIKKKETKDEPKNVKQ